MPRFYLHLFDESGFCEDQEGAELPDLPAARASAVRSLRDILAGYGPKGRVEQRNIH